MGNFKKQYFKGQNLHAQDNLKTMNIRRFSISHCIAPSYDGNQIVITYLVEQSMFWSHFTRVNLETKRNFERNPK